MEEIYLNINKVLFCRFGIKKLQTKFWTNDTSIKKAFKALKEKVYIEYIGPKKADGYKVK